MAIVHVLPRFRGFDIPTKSVRQALGGALRISEHIVSILYDHATWTKAPARDKRFQDKLKLRDPRFTARAANKEAHNGYQKWHKDLDEEVADYINRNPDLDLKKSTAWLYKRYSKPDLGGLGENK